MTGPGLNPRETGLVLLDFNELFGNPNPVILEIGSGKGRFLISSAESAPDMNYLGVEKSLHYFRVVADRIHRRGLKNARVINFDAAAVIAEMLAPESISEVHVYFPDPWPKRREQKRRLIREEVLRSLERVMKASAVGYYVTDHREYFEAALPVLERVFEVEAGEVPPERPARTNYEAKYRTEGRPIFEAIFRRKR